VLIVEAEQHLGDGQTDQLRVRQAWLAAGLTGPGVGAQQLVDGDVQCDDEVVETGAHETSPEVDVASATPTLGGLVLLVTARRPRSDTESII
jgi:hypothetical protein